MRVDVEVSIECEACTVNDLLLEMKISSGSLMIGKSRGSGGSATLDISEACSVHAGTVWCDRTQSGLNDSVSGEPCCTVSLQRWESAGAWFGHVHLSDAVGVFAYSATTTGSCSFSILSPRLCYFLPPFFTRLGGVLSCGQPVGDTLFKVMPSISVHQSPRC